MPTLREVQAAMAATLLHGGASAAALIVEGAERLDIYRNTVEGVLIGALRLTFPAVERLVGEDFFAAMALAFARRHPPSGGCLNDWGGALADFLDGFGPAAGIPYLPDVARLEWAVSVAANAPDIPPLAPARAAFPLRPHPSFSLIAVTWPAAVLRRAVLENDMNGLRLAPSPGWLAVHRLGEEVAVRPLDAGAAMFTRSLFTEAPFATAPSLDHITLLAEHLAAGCFRETSDDPIAAPPDRPA